MARYGLIPIDQKDINIYEREILILLYRYSNFNTNIAGYTVGQLVASSDKVLGLTTQKVRTILKNLEKKGYIQTLTRGSKGKESTLKITIKQQLFNNNVTNKTEQLQSFKGVEQQQSNNNITTLSKKKENNNILIDSYTQNNDLKTTINDFISMRNKIKKPVTQRALKGILNKLDSFTNNDFEKILILENSIENCWLSVYELKNKKASTKVDTGKKNNNSVNPNICNTGGKYTRGVEML